jgi:hypothetical protein
MFKRWSLLVLFVIIWARPPRPSEWPTFKPPAAGVGSLSPRAALGHHFINPPVLAEATPPRFHYSPRRPPLQPRPASTTAAFRAAPSLAICPPFGFPRRRRLRRPVASKVASLRRRRLRRRAAFVPAGRGFRYGLRGLPFQRVGVLGGCHFGRVYKSKLQL